VEQHDAEFEAPLDGRRFRVHEHNLESPYRPGFIAIGRLIPLREDRWLRSPGMLIFEPPRDGGGEDLVRTFAQGFATVTDTAPALLAEGMLATIFRAGKVPRPVPPAASPAEARALLDDTTAALEKHGLVEHLSADDVPPALRARPGEQRKYMSYDVDDVVGPWLTALGEQARRSRGAGPGPGTRKRARAKRRRGKRG